MTSNIFDYVYTSTNRQPYENDHFGKFNDNWTPGFLVKSSFDNRDPEYFRRLCLVSDWIRSLGYNSIACASIKLNTSYYKNITKWLDIFFIVYANSSPCELNISFDSDRNLHYLNYTSDIGKNYNVSITKGFLKSNYLVHFNINSNGTYADTTINKNSKINDLFSINYVNSINNTDATTQTGAINIRDKRHSHPVIRLRILKDLIYKSIEDGKQYITFRGFDSNSGYAAFWLLDATYDR